jgi:AcrR family transcriptional regulator
MAVAKRKQSHPRGAATSARILSAATRLFCEHGYLDTTMATIAAEADVSVQTLYLRYGSKAAILSAALDVAIVGDVDPVPVLDREWPKTVLATEDGVTAVRVLVANTIEIVARVHPLFAVIRAAAADPDVAEVLAKNKRERFEAMTTMAASLSRRKGFARRVGPTKAADLLYAWLAEETYELFVIERGWTQRDWERWTTEKLIAEFFPASASE